MKFDPDNEVVKLCAKGMELEGKGQSVDAARLFNEAWRIATTDFEKFTAAHYVARHQQSVTDKLNWDKTALQHALDIPDESIKATLPSLCLNIAKCYEDLGDNKNARINYQAALSFCDFLPNEGYGKMIRSGILNGLERTD